MLWLGPIPMPGVELDRCMVRHRFYGAMPGFHGRPGDAIDQRHVHRQHRGASVSARITRRCSDASCARLLLRPAHRDARSVQGAAARWTSAHLWFQSDQHVGRTKTHGAFVRRCVQRRAIREPVAAARLDGCARDRGRRRYAIPDVSATAGYRLVRTQVVGADARRRSSAHVSPSVACTTCSVARVRSE